MFLPLIGDGVPLEQIADGVGIADQGRAALTVRHLIADGR